MSPETQSLGVCNERHEALDNLIKSLQSNHAAAELERKNDLDKIYKKLDEFGQRLPTWAVALASIGSLVIGILAAMVGKH